jgi:hypothetical protein
MTATDAQRLLYEIALCLACSRENEAVQIVNRAAEALGDIDRPGPAAMARAHAIIAQDGQRRVLRT